MYISKWGTRSIVKRNHKSENMFNFHMITPSCTYNIIFKKPNASTALFLEFYSWHALALKSMTGAGRSSLYGASFASSSCWIRWWRCRYWCSRTWTTSWSCRHILISNRSWICWSSTAYLVVILPIFMLTESSTISCHITTTASFICFSSTVPATL